MDEYAIMRFTLVCTTAKNEPMTSDPIAMAATIGSHSLLTPSNACRNTRRNPANAATFTAEAMKATIGVGEP